MELSNTFENGLADGTTITAANSDDGTAGDAFDAVNIGGTGAIVVDTDRAAHGSRSALITPDSSTGCYFEWNNTSAGDATEEYGRLYIYRTAHPNDIQWLFRGQDSAGADCCLFIWYSDTKAYVYRLTAPGTLGDPVAFTNAVPLDEWVRFEWHLINHATTGLMEVKMFSEDSTSPIETVTRSNINTGGDIRYRYIGHANSGYNIGGNFSLDDLALSSEGYIGPLSIGGVVAWLTA